MHHVVLALVIVALAGVALAFQAPINAALGAQIGSSIAATTVSFGVGFAALACLTAFGGDLPSMFRIGAVSPVMLAGGLLGAFYVWAVLWAIPSLGALSTICALVLGQMTAALVIDATGVLGLAVQAVTPQRFAAAALVASGVILSRL